MLNRRFLRIKVFQALYAFFQSDSNDLTKSEKELYKSIEQIYDLYLYVLIVLKDIHTISFQLEDDARHKNFPIKEDIDFFSKLNGSKAFEKVAKNSKIQRLANEKGLGSFDNKEILKKIILSFKNNNECKKALLDVNSFKDEKDFLVAIYQDFIAEHDTLQYILEEKNIYWSSDFYLVNSIISKLIENMEEDSDENYFVLPLYKDPEDDPKLVSELFKHSVMNREAHEKMIAERAKNWEVDRIALIDMILMNMAITELTDFVSIPIKVTLNEYIEISKLYSTRKSKDFINGILDKITVNLKSSGKISKAGRGLIE